MSLKLVAATNYLADFRLCCYTGQRMSKTAANKKTTTANEDEIERYAAAMSAKQQFISASLDMGWRLALTVLVPVFIGAWLDRRYDTSPSWTLTALFVAIGGAALVVWKTINAVNKDQAGGKKK